MKDSLTTSLIVVIVGAIVTVVGMFFIPGDLGIGLTGFGAAHIFLGLLDMLRPSVRQAGTETPPQQENE
ncbi:MAG: hypothetical protein ACOYBM_07605 [Dethiobacteria bacterium]|jgi:hypothetical protein|nr:hypothetical protein [Bacillota bacterium]